jgi:predicted ATP-dependent protease
VVYEAESRHVFDLDCGVFGEVEPVKGVEEKIELFSMGSEQFILSLPPELQLVLQRLQQEIVSPVEEHEEGLRVAETH